MRRSRRASVSRSVVAYVRVSSADQRNNGVSLEAQEQRLRAYCAANGIERYEVIVDAGISAKDLQRPGFGRVLDAIRRDEVSTVIVCKLDRATRSVGDLANLLAIFQRHQVAFVSLSEQLDTSTATGRMMLHLLGTFAEFERALTAERTTAGLAHLRRSGRAYARTPFGYRRDGDLLLVDDREQRALATIRAMRSAGDTLQRCANWLTAHGLPTPQGGSRWYPASVKAMLESRIASETAVA